MGSLMPVSFKLKAAMLRLYRLIATMDAAAPLPSLADQEPTMGLSIEPCPRLGTETIGRPLGGEDMTVVVRNVAEMDFVFRQRAYDRAPQRDPTRLSCFRAEMRNHMSKPSRLLVSVYLVSWIYG
jgi:hypothetical protein